MKKGGIMLPSLCSAEALDLEPSFLLKIPKNGDRSLSSVDRTNLLKKLAKFGVVLLRDLSQMLTSFLRSLKEFRQKR